MGFLAKLFGFGRKPAQFEPGLFVRTKELAVGPVSMSLRFEWDFRDDGTVTFRHFTGTLAMGELKARPSTTAPVEETGTYRVHGTRITVDLPENEKSPLKMRLVSRDTLKMGTGDMLHRHPPEDDAPAAVSSYERGEAALDDHDYERAITCFSEAIRADPQDAVAYANRATAYDQSGQPDEALPDYDRAAQLDPENPEIFYNRGVTYAKKGEHDRAIADFTQTARLNPNHALAYYCRARIYGAKGEPGKAEADFAKASELGYEPE